MFQVIPGNLQSYVSTNHGPSCFKTLLAHLSVNCWLIACSSLFERRISGRCAFIEDKAITMNVSGPLNCEFQVSTSFHAFKQINRKGHQSSWGMPGPEITWWVKKR